MVDHFGEAGEIGLGEALVLGAVEDLAVLDRGLGSQFEEVIGRIGADEHLQAAEARRAAGSSLEPHVVASDGRPPAALADDRFHLKAGKLVGHLGQAALDAFAEFEAVLGVQALQLFFVEFPIALGPCLLVARPLAPLADVGRAEVAAGCQMGRRSDPDVAAGRKRGAGAFATVYGGRARHLRGGTQPAGSRRHVTAFAAPALRRD